MDAFESLVAMLLAREGYWTAQSLKVDLTKEEKRDIERPSCPRWEIDVVAYSGGKNEILAVECKSFLDSPGVVFRNGKFEPEKRYKLFANASHRTIILERLRSQLVESGACAAKSKLPTLGLATGRIARKSNRSEMKAFFAEKGWKLFDDEWIVSKLTQTKDAGYENDVAHIVTKLLQRTSGTG